MKKPNGNTGFFSHRGAKLTKNTKKASNPKSYLCVPCDLRAFVQNKFQQIPIQNILRAAQYSLLIAVLFLFSCKTTPATQVVTTLNLNSGASAYILADVERARPILELLLAEELENEQARDMMERTSSVAVAIFPPETGRRFQLEAVGSYPSFWAGLAFSFDRNWQKRRSLAGRDYWYSGGAGLSIMVSARLAYVSASTTTEPADPLPASRGVLIPEGFTEFRQASPLSCWLEDPAPMIRRVMNEAGIPLQFPVQQLFFNLNSADDGKWEATLRFLYETTSQARGMASILSLAANFMSDGQSHIASIFFANPPVLTGTNVDVKTAALDEGEITLLLNMFL